LRLVADANILVAAYLRDSTVRRIILFSDVQFLVPEFIFEELENHLPELTKRSGLTEAESKRLLDRLRGRFAIVPEELVSQQLQVARAAMKGIDPKDTAYLACALCVPCDGIWSDDPHMKRQDLVVSFTTGELLDRLRREGFPAPP